MHDRRAAAIAARVDRAHEALAPSTGKPEGILRQDGTPDPRLLRWAELVGLPLAWLLEGDERPLLIATNRMAKASVPNPLASPSGKVSAGGKFRGRSRRPLPPRRAKDVVVD